MLGIVLILAKNCGQGRLIIIPNSEKSAKIFGRDKENIKI